MVKLASALILQNTTQRNSILSIVGAKYNNALKFKMITNVDLF